MANYISTIKELVISSMTNLPEIKSKADRGDAVSCFQMGMIHLLGIETIIDFEKAGKYLGNLSLADNPDANRLLGFISECEGNYSLAFMNYAKAEGDIDSSSKKTYISKVFTERNNLQAYFKKLKLPDVLNKEITAVLNDNIKGGVNTVEASIKLAMICNDKETSLIAAQSLFEVGDNFAAKSWLQNGGITNSNPLFSQIDNKLKELTGSLSVSDSMQVIDIAGESLLFEDSELPSVEEIRQFCSDAAFSSKQKWQEQVPQLLEPVIEAGREYLENIKTAEQAEEIRQKKMLKEKVETYSGFALVIILSLSGYYLYSNYSFLKATIILVVIFVIGGVAINIVEQKLGIESGDDK